MSNPDWTNSLQNGESLYQGILGEVMYEMIDDLTLGICFDVHRACKLRTLLLADTDEEAQKEYEIVDKPGFDVFGQAPTKKQFECVCPNCQRTLAASRFAPHLEKCMGMGRNSSRIASRRIANVTVKRDSDDSGGDEENDNDWNYSQQDRKVKKIKKERSTNSPRRNTKAVRLRNGNLNAHNNNNNHNNSSNNNNNNNSSIVSTTTATTTTASLTTVHTGSTSTTSSSNNNNSSTVDNQNNGGSEPVSSIYETMTLEERKSLLMHTCGVISEHTKKMCTRSIRCPQHTDEQRFKLRQYILNQGEPNAETDDIHIDIDTYEDGDSQSLRETLQWEASSNSSPADSTSTNNSTSSRKRGSKNNSKTKCKKQKISRTGSSGNINDNSGNQNAGTYDFV